jgi:4-amino-4-deoxy-L-arabinose transferase-like glycosyltransferase
LAGRLISLFFGTLTLIAIFYLVKEAVGQKAAIFSGLFYAFHPYLANYSGMLLSEATYWGLLTLSIYFFWTGLKRGKVIRLVVSGLFLGLAYLTRPEGIGYLFVFLIWVIFCGGLRKGWFKKILLLGSLILPFLIFSIPYMIHIRQETGQWLISKKAAGVQSQLLKWDEDEVSPSKGDEEQKFVEGNSKILSVAKNIFQYFPFTTYHYLRAYHFALWLFLIFGLIRIRQREIKGELFLASIVFFHLFSLSTFTPSTIRYSVPLIPISLFWAGVGVSEMERYLQKIKKYRAEPLIFGFIVLVLLVQLPQSLKPERRHREERKKVGLWLKQNTPKDSIIMSNSPFEAFYADREFILLPAGISIEWKPAKSFEEIIGFAKRKGVRYIVVDKNTMETNPDFVKATHSSDLREFYQYKEKTGSKVTVYEVVY